MSGPWPATASHVNRAKLSAFAVSGFIAGLAGCLLVVANQQYVESPFTVTASLAVFTATAVGGLGSVVGAVGRCRPGGGSAVFLPPSWQLFPSAFGVLIVLLAFPGGVSEPAVPRSRPLRCRDRPPPRDRHGRRGAGPIGGPAVDVPGRQP